MPVSTRYRWRKGALVEELAHQRIVYGDWYKLFGCWTVSPEMRAVEVLPNWTVLNSSGFGCPAEQVSCTKNLSMFDPRLSPLGAKASIRFVEFFNHVPNIIRKLAAQYVEHQWCLMDMCFQVPGFWRFLHEERANNRLGYTSGCISLAKVQSSLNRAERRNLASSLSTKRRKDLLSELVGWSCQNRHVRLLEKTTVSATGDEISNILHAYEDDGERAKVLSQIEHISNEIIDATIRLPDGFIHRNLQLLLSVGMSVDLLVSNIDEATEFLTPQQKRESGRAFKNIRNSDEYWKWTERWTEAGAYNVQLPPPPMSLPGPFLALTSYGDLVKEGRLMRNCVATYWRDVFEGDVYIYHWTGSEEATVSLFVDGNGDWSVDEALGIGNEQLSDETLQEISKLIENNSDFILPDRMSSPADINLEGDGLLSLITLFARW
jgi:hypothetical protein